MSDLNVIYRIAADISGLQSGVNRAAKATEGLESMAATVGKSLTAAFTVGAVVNFAKDLVTAADALVKLSAKTGISIEALQLLQAAGDDAGNTVEEMAGAVNQLQNRLAEGNDSAVGALRALGIEYENFQRLMPDQQFIRISDAIRQIEDPAERVRLAVDLFGKQGMSVLPTLTQGFDDLKDSVHGMSEQTAKDLDAAGDAIVRWGRNIKNWTAEAVVGFKNIITYNEGTKLRDQRLAAEELAASLKKAGQEAARLAQQDLFQRPLTVTAPSGAALKELERDLDRATQKQIEANKAAQAAAEAQEQHNRTLRDYNNWLVMREFEDAAEQMKRLAAEIELAARNQDMFNKLLFYGNNQLETMTDLMRALEKSLLTPAGTGWLSEMPNQLETFHQTLRSKVLVAMDAWTSAIGGIANEFVKLAQVSDGAMGDIARSIGTVLQALALAKQSVEQIRQGIAQWGQGKRTAGAAGIGIGLLGAAGAIDQATNYESKKANVASGAATGAAIGTMILPGIGTAIGAGVGAIVGWVKAGKLEKETNRIREAFVQMHGGLGKLNELAASAGATLTKMLNAKTPEEYTRAINELNDALAFQDNAMKTLDETVQKYGLTIEELGPAFARQQLDRRAQELYQDFKVLAAAGIPVANILEKMAPSINDFVQASIRAGTEIPIAMKPILQQMIDHGLLLDENGQAYTSLEDTGLSFTETMSQGFDRLIAVVNKLTDAIARGLGIALEELPEEVNIDINVNVDTQYNDEGQPETPHIPGQPEIPSYAAAGGVVTRSGIRPVRWTPIGSDVVPAMLAPGELVVPAAEAQAILSRLDAIQAVTAQPAAVGPEHVELNLTLNIDGVFSEGDLVSTIQRRVVPILHETWNANVAGTRTQARDVLGVA